MQLGVSLSKVYKDLVKKLETGENREAVFMEIKEICENCRPLSPIMCVELCQIWRLKREYRDAFLLVEKPSLPELLNLMKNSRRLKIMESLIEKPFSLKDIRDGLKEIGYYHSLSTLRDNYITPLEDADFIQKEDNLYKITSRGKIIYNVLINSEITKLPIQSRYDEKILMTLLSGPKSYNELTEIVPNGSLYRSLKRLKRSDLIIKTNLSGHIFYFATKRRPTRRLSPTEMRIFKALPKEGISVRDLTEKVGISARRVYKYLRRLRHKRHVEKVEKTTFYRVTDAGRRLAQSLNAAYNLIQS